MAEFKKVSMGLSYRSLANVEELCNLLNEENKTKVVSISLQITKDLLRMAQEGRKIIVRNKKGGESELKFKI